jgi:hypothetical protein
MKTKSQWQRVTKQHPCPVCQHSTWCLLGEESVMCMRVPSQRVKLFKNEETGYLHPLTGGVRPRVNRPDPPPRPSIDCLALWRQWRHDTNQDWIDQFADSLGVYRSALEDLWCCWAAPHGAFAFPMKDGTGRMVGIRLRSESGVKWAVTGSHQGLFKPAILPQETVWLPEGPTSTAAALSLGLYAIGRPSCSGGMQDLAIVIRRLGIKRAVITADPDEFERNGQMYHPGLDGAQMLQRHLPCPSTLMMIPGKDLRGFLRAGGTRELLEAELENCIWTRKT